MKREIKFRAWDDKRMVYLSDLSIGLKKGTKKIHPYAYFATDTFGGHVSLRKHEIMQFTGLKDKNGKEIYEGDILRSESWGIDRRSKSQYHIVEWDKHKWVACGYNGESKVKPDIDVKPDFEVIGNIYENPELL